MKFLIDLCLSPKIVSELHSLGHSAIRVDKLGMDEAEDREIFEYAIAHKMVLLTADLDFGQILAYTHYNKPSTIVFRLRNPSHEKMMQYLPRLTSPEFTKNLEEGSIIVVEEGRIRVRKLPIDVTE